MTETDDLAQALDAAESRWPGLSRPQILVRLALEGDRAAQQERDENRRRRLAALREHSGMLTGAYSGCESNGLVIVLDAGVLIAYLDGEDKHHGRAEALLAREIDDDFAANPLILAEVLVVPVLVNRLEDVRAALQGLELRELPFPADTAVKLADLCATTNLTMPDCCVLLAAEAAHARLASFDDRLPDSAAK